MKSLLFISFFIILNAYFWERQEFNNEIIKEYNIYEISKLSKEIKINIKCKDCHFYLIRQGSIENYKNRLPFLPLLDSGIIKNEYFKYYGDHQQLEQGLFILIQNNLKESQEITFILDSFIPDKGLFQKYLKISLLGIFGSFAFCLIVTLILSCFLVCLLFTLLWKGKEKDLNKILDRCWNIKKNL